MQLPEFSHLSLDLSAKRRVFAVGDIHGYLHLLKERLAEVAFDPELDALVCVGDLIDRGPCSEEVLDLYHNSPWFWSVLGNHEVMMAEAMARGWYKDELQEDQAVLLWLVNGGNWGLTKSPETLMRLMGIIASLPSAITLTLPSGKTVGICHAEPSTANWMETQEFRGSVFDRPSWLWGRSRAKAVVAQVVYGVDISVHGHTPLYAGVHKTANSFFIDTGSCSPGRGYLTLFDLEKEQAFPSSPNFSG